MSSKEKRCRKNKAAAKRRPLKPTAEDLDRRAPPQTHPAAVMQQARYDPRSLTPTKTLHLQRTIGNRAVGQLVPPGAQRQPIKEASNVIQRTLDNHTEEPKFIPLYNIKVMDEQHYYLYHGTFADNLGGIGLKGLDPTEGGGERGANRYERHRSSDAGGLMKYTTDPNIAMIYAEEPTKMKPPQVGVFLEVRVKKQEIHKLFNENTSLGDKTPFWRRERGGENKRQIKGVGAERLALNEPGGPGEKDPIRAVETNQAVLPDDIKVIGFYLPAKSQINEQELIDKLNHQVEAVAIDMETFTTSKIYEDAWQNWGKL